MIKTPIDLQDLRRRIYAKAKAEPSWRFWGLYVHVCKRRRYERRTSSPRRKRSPGGRRGDVRGIEAEGRGAISSNNYERNWFGARIDPCGCGRWRSESGRKIPNAVDSNDSRPSSPGCAQAHPGADIRGGLPTGVVWISAEEVSAGRDTTSFRSNLPGKTTSSIWICDPTSTTFGMTSVGENGRASHDDDVCTCSE